MTNPTQLAQSLVLPSGLTLPNRIAKAAMSERLGAAGAPSVELLGLYQHWASGGAGLLITGNVMVDGAHVAEKGNVVVQGAQHAAALRRWAKVAKSGGTPVLVQINHPGRQAPRWATRRPVAPSAVPMQGAGGAFATPRALEHGEIEAIVQRFAQSAALLRAAGFDGVQIHAAHGYLISQFLSPRTNLRDDAWGGNAAKRRRFLLEIVRAVRTRVGSAFTLAVKLNSADFQRGGFGRDESLDVIAALADEGIDLLEISGGTYESAAMFEETIPQRDSSRRREAFFIDFADDVRRRVSLPLMVTGGFRTAAGMNDALASGSVDVVGLGRPMAAEPDLPGRLLSGSAAGARPVRLATGVAKLDALIQGAWYGTQLGRMGRGEAPNPELSRWVALWNYLWPRRAPTPLDSPAASLPASRAIGGAA